MTVSFDSRRSGLPTVLAALADLSQHTEKFQFVTGVHKRTAKDHEPVNVAASNEDPARFRC